MSKERLEAIVEAMLAPASTPELIRELGEMAAEEPEDEQPDEDTAPVDEAAAKRVQDWLRELTLARLREKRE